MIEWLVSPLLDFVRAHGFWAILLLMTAESACVPVPSEPVMILGGYLVFIGALPFSAVVVAGTAGNLLGSLIAYWAGIRSEEAIYSRYAHTPLVGHKLKVAEKWFSKYGEPAVFFARLLPLVRTFISLPAGVSHMGLARFVVYTSVGSIIWNAALTYMGVAAGPHWERALDLAHETTYVMLAATVVVVAAVAWWRWRAKSGRKDASPGA